MQAILTQVFTEEEANAGIVTATYTDTTHISIKTYNTATTPALVTTIPFYFEIIAQ